VLSQLPCDEGLVIIESTMNLTMWRQLVPASMHAVVSPRRDWFVSATHTLHDLPRIYGANDPVLAEAAADVLGRVCHDLRRASDAETAILTKLIENAVLHAGACLAGELATSFPESSITEAFALASSHWRIPHYYPSAGIGGYCIPLAARYLTADTAAPGPLLQALQTHDHTQPFLVADVLEASYHRRPDGLILVLGLTYKGDIPVVQESPALCIVERLLALGLPVHVQEPYASVIPRLDGWHPRSLCQRPLEVCIASWAQASVVFVHTDHAAFRQIPLGTLMCAFRHGTMILDNLGIWASYATAFKEAGLDYRQLGATGWMRHA
jgi:UDP-N-acetyl-D-mannosaminuronate dehydrogenase